MTEKIQFTAELVDKISNPAKKASEAFTKLGGAGKSAFESLKAGVGKLVGAAFAFNQVTQAVETVFVAIDDLAKSSALRGGIEVAFARFGENGTQSLQKMRETVNLTGASLEEFYKIGAKNLGQLLPQELEYLARVSSDVSKATNRDFTDVFSELSDKVAEFRNKKVGDLGLGDFKELLKITGTDSSAVLKVLGTDFKGLEKGLKSGTIQTKELVNAMAQIQGTGRSGLRGAQESADNLSESIQRLRNTFSELKTNTFDRLTKDLRDIKKLFSDVTGFEFKINMEPIIFVGKVLYAALFGTFVILGALGVAVTKFGSLWLSAWDKIFDGVRYIFSDDFIDDLKQIGTFITDGIIEGLSLGYDKVVNLVGELAQATKDKFKKILGIQSPSKIFQGFGKNITQGLIKGVQADIPRVKNAFSKLGEVSSQSYSKSVQFTPHVGGIIQRFGGNSGSITDTNEGRRRGGNTININVSIPPMMSLGKNEAKEVGTIIARAITEDLRVKQLFG